MKAHLQAKGKVWSYQAISKIKNKISIYVRNYVNSASSAKLRSCNYSRYIHIEMIYRYIALYNTYAYITCFLLLQQLQFEQSVDCSVINLHSATSQAIKLPKLYFFFC